MNQTKFKQTEIGLIPENWGAVRLSAVVDIIGGGTPKTTNPEYWGGDIPWLSVVDFNNDYRNVYSTEKTITQSGLDNSSTKILDKGDIIISARGTVGALSQLGRKMAFNQSCYGLETKDGVANDFLYYMLKYKINSIKSSTHGSVFDTITRKTFDILEIPFPPLPEQHAIAEILSSLDDKIELNRRMNATLEQIAQAIFKQWFIDFEFPDENGQPYKSSGGEMVESGLGEIPRGWNVGKLGEIIDIFDSKRIPLSKKERTKRQGEYPYYGASSIMDYVDDYIFDGIYLLMGEDGTVIDEKGYPILQYVWGKFWVNNHAHVIAGKYPFFNEYLYLFFKTKKIKHIVTGAVQLKINQKNLKSLRVLIPSEEVLIFFKEITDSLFSMYRNCDEENKRLMQVRDTFLPKLMSGKIRIQL